MRAVRIPELALSRYVARWAPTAQHILCSSDVEAWRLDELLALATPDERAAWDGLSLGYTPAAGSPALRREIASLYDDVGPDQVVCFSGVEEAVFVMVNSLLGQGDHAVGVCPGYGSLHEVARAAGAQVTLVPLDEDRGWRLPHDRLAAEMRPTTRLLILNWPHNPTGALPDRGAFEAMLDLAARTGARVLSDESYRLLEHDPRDRLPAAAERSDGAVSVAGLSKPFGLAGLRVGWAVSRDADLLRRASAFRDYLSACTAAPSEALALVALRARDEMLGRSRRLIAANLALLEEFLGRHAELFGWQRPRAGSTAFLRLDDGVPADRFAAGLRRAEGVLVLPGSVYGCAGNHLRLSFGGSDFASALARLERFTGGVRRRGR
ncbi:MAG TPA: aminotransferase class I/II-fold pyridoxal phosphate-dependent enzyme [Miltoncostaea sp.]|nr:aminotransferase class I/II-fold pyridoxal phosphate-dependent enzyme [Miltoncostaea sp.]